MVNSETTKRPEYHAWLIRHAGWVLLITLLGSGILFPIARLFELPESGFRQASFWIISAIYAAVFYPTLAIIIMRLYGAREQTIKNTAMNIFIFFVISWPITYFVNADLFRRLLSTPM